jgi:hypothetical protein
MEPGSGGRQVVLLASGCCPVRPAPGAAGGGGGGGGGQGEEAACAAAVMAACAPTGAAACFETAAAQPACAALLAGPRDDARLTCAAPVAARAVSYLCAEGSACRVRVPRQQRPLAASCSSLLLVRDRWCCWSFRRDVHEHAAACSKRSEACMQSPSCSALRRAGQIEPPSCHMLSLVEVV